MALILFGILFLFGATGMERRRGMVFGVITGLVLFAWMLPIVIRDGAQSGGLYAIVESAASLVLFVGLSVLVYFLGRWARRLAMALRQMRSH